MKQGEIVRLRVRATPNAPVTFTSLDLGQFDNQLNTISVPANEKGIAEAQFRGAPGTYGDVAIVAGSPMLAEQVRFTVYVEAPNMVELSQKPPGTQPPPTVKTD